MKSIQVAILTFLLSLSVGISRVAFAQEPKVTRQSASEKQVIAGERAIWDALKNKDYAYFDRTVAGAMNVDAGGMMISKQHDLKEYEGLVTTSYSFDSVQTRVLTPDVILVTYKATYDQTDAGGNKAPSPAYMMTVWQRKGGKWVPVAHSETPAKSK